MAQGNYFKSLFFDTLKAHALKFNSQLYPKYGNEVGWRVLIAFLLTGVVIFIALRAAFNVSSVSNMPEVNLAFVIILLTAFTVLQLKFVRTPAVEFGLRRFAEWSHLERLYFFQVVSIFTLLSTLIFHEHLQELLHLHGVPRFIFITVLSGILWGMVQELLYRGWLQTELTRRFGTAIGLLTANLAFTFGPLHFNYLYGPDGVSWSILIAVFGIGLFFGIVYHRSGNVWLPAIFHGLWPLNMA